MYQKTLSLLLAIYNNFFFFYKILRYHVRGFGQSMTVNLAGKICIYALNVGSYSWQF